jgi:hypothetical protein
MDHVYTRLFVRAVGLRAARLSRLPFASMPTATRSQLTLPELDTSTLTESPLKNARQSVRNVDSSTRTMDHTPQHTESRFSNKAQPSASRHLKRVSPLHDDMSAEKFDKRIAKRPKVDNTGKSFPALIAACPKYTL